MGTIMNYRNKAKSRHSRKTSDVEKMRHDYLSLENMLTTTFLLLPPSFRFSTGQQGPDVAFLNICLHGASICLQLAAIETSLDVVDNTDTCSDHHSRLCKSAAGEIFLIMRMTMHIDPSKVSVDSWVLHSLTKSISPLEVPFYSIWSLCGVNCVDQAIQGQQYSPERPQRPSLCTIYDAIVGKTLAHDDIIHPTISS